MVFNAKFTLFRSHFNEILTFWTDLKKKPSNIKFHENPSSGNRVVTCRHTDRRTDMTKLIVVFRNFAKGPKRELLKNYQLYGRSKKVAPFNIRQMLR